MEAYRLLVASSAERTLHRLPEAAAAMVEFMTRPLLENPTRVGKPLMFDLEGYLSARRGPYCVILPRFRGQPSIGDSSPRKGCPHAKNEPALSA